MADNIPRNTAAPNVEITPEMVEAGVVPLLRYHPDRASEDDIVVEIFRSMLAASKSPARPRQ
jgi:hypothetical protein